METSRNHSILIQVSLLVLLSAGLVPYLPAQVTDHSTDYFQLTLEELGDVVITPSKMPQSIGNVTQKVDIVRRILSPQFRACGISVN